MGKILTGDEMRKSILLILICLFLFSVRTESKTGDLRFVMVFDTKQENISKMKNELVEEVNELLEYVSEKSYAEYLEHTVHELDHDNKRVLFYQNTLYFYMGDGQGIRVEGNFVKNSFCLVEVKPKSFLRKWFNF